MCGLSMRFPNQKFDHRTTSIRLTITIESSSNLIDADRRTKKKKKPSRQIQPCYTMHYYYSYCLPITIEIETESICVIEST